MTAILHPLIFVFAFIIQLFLTNGDDYLNSPPVVLIERNWYLSSKTPVGTLIKHISAADNEGDELEFGLELSAGYNLKQDNDTRLPFTIDSKNGNVYTNESLEAWASKNIFMYVTAFDGHQTSKIEVSVTIEDLDNNLSSNKGRAKIPPMNGMKLPSFPMYPRYPSVPQTPLNDRRVPLTRLTNLNVSKTEENRNNATNFIMPPKNPITLFSPNESVPDVFKQYNTIKYPVPDELPPSPYPNITGSIAKPKNAKGVAHSFEELIPFLVTVVASVFISIAILACLFRKRICRKRNKLKNDDMKKTVCNGLSIEESMVLQHWRGPRGTINSYDTWDSDCNNTQNALSAANGSKTTDSWEFPRHRIKVFDVLGEGCFGQVWKCEALDIDKKQGPTIVAVKMLKENAGERERLDLIQELQVMKMLDPHPNVVRLLGCCTEKEPLFLIMEYVSNGKLQSYLRQSRAQRYYNNMHGHSNSLTSRDLTSFCYQIAKGMQYLSSKGIIHRDLAARNVLVGENKTCKVADFGFARDVMSNHIYERKSEGRLPIRWMAPESLYDNIFSVKSDIWSYGIVVWEIVTLGSTPYPGIPASEVLRRVKDGYRLDKPEHCRRELYNIMYYCWDKEPKERPNFSELIDLLEQLLLTETDYIQLERFPDHSYYNMSSLSGEKL